MAAARYSLQRTLQLFETNPVVYRKAIVESWESDREAFWQDAAAIMNAGPLPDGAKESSGCKFLLSFLLQHGSLLQRLVDPDSFTKEQAVRAARRLLLLDPALDVKLAQQVSTQSGAATLRAMDILDALSDPANLLPLLGPLLRHPDEKVRSKVALMVGKGNRNPAWVAKQLQETNGRVRANAVESIWGMDTEEAQDLFILAAQDEVPRTAINGAIGLYLAGRLETLELLFGFSVYRDENFRNSAAWAMGKLQDPRFQRALTALIRDRSPLVRSNAIRAMGRLRNYRSMLEKQGRLLVKILHSECNSAGKRALSAVIRRNDSGEPLTLAPLNIVIEEHNEAVVHYTIQKLPKGDTAAIGMVLPAPTDLDTATHSAVDLAFRTATGNKPPGQPWGVVCFANQAGLTDGTPPLFNPNIATVRTCLPPAQAKPYSGALPAAQAMLQTARGGDNMLILVGSSIPESTATVLYRRQQLPLLVTDAVATSTRIHCIAPAACPSIHMHFLRDLADSTGGTFTAAANADHLGQHLRSLLLASRPNYRITYDVAKPDPGFSEVFLQVHSEFGIGEDKFAAPAPAAIAS
ncbi:MAG: HEAT repeat domain-containing protein [Bryobacterales bacterium]|nr:HEAT repeat domain-containing protein [Bryobacterales bacterium]